MTNEDAAVRLRFYETQVCVRECMAHRGHFAECDFCEDIEMMDKAIKALEKQNKYRWHDLRKNPNDLPDDNDFKKEYLVCDGDKCTISRYYGRGEYCEGQYEYPEGVFEANMIDFDVIAWKEIEPFEEVKE